MNDDKEVSGWNKHRRNMMKSEVNSEGGLLLKEVFSGVVLETGKGHKLTVCMRDDTMEMQVVGTGRWFRADMESGEIYEMAERMLLPDNAGGKPQSEAKSD